jgi:hypothetical protein
LTKDKLDILSKLFYNNFNSSSQLNNNDNYIEHNTFNWNGHLPHNVQTLAMVEDIITAQVSVEFICYDDYDDRMV